MSTKLPMATRAKMAPHTAAMAALPRSVRVRSIESRMTGRSAAGAGVLGFGFWLHGGVEGVLRCRSVGE